MKKTILLILLLLGILFAPIIDSNENPRFFRYDLKFLSYHDTIKYPEVIKWEYIKTRLFKSGTALAPKFIGPILLNLEGASPAHKAAVDEVIIELKELLPEKTISYYKEHTGYDHKYVLEKVADSSSYNDLFLLYTKSIKLYFKTNNSFDEYIRPTGRISEFNISVLKDSTVIKRNDAPTMVNENINGAIIHFNFSKSTKYQKQKKYIKYELLRALCYFSDNSTFNNRLNKKHELRLYKLLRANGVFMSETYNPENYRITKYDEFLLKKLYSNDFLTQFKNYLITNYSLRYQVNFFHKEKVKSLSKIITTSLGLLIFVLSLLILHNKRFKYSYLNYFIPLSIITLTLLALNQLHEYISMEHNIDFRVIILIIIVSAIIVSLSQSLFLWFIEKFLINNITNFVSKLILKVTLTFSCYLILYFFFNMYQWPYLNNIITTGLIIALLRGVYIYLNHYTESIIKHKDLEFSQLKELQLATELNSLHAQINPHFLYNSLNSIASLAHINAKKTEEMALSLSDLFKYSINRKGEKLSTIRDEVEMAENYLKIEKIRFEDRLEFSVDVEPSLLENKIPRYVLQPLIENAVKHGTSNLEGKGNIHLNITKNNNILMISVGDNGPYFPEGLVSGHGLQSVYDLLRLSYGEQATMNWGNLPKKKITISICSNS